MATASNIRAGRAFVELTLDQSGLERGLRSAQKRMADFSATLTAVGAKMLGAVTVASTPFALATRVFSGFDDELRKVQAVTGATNTEFQNLTRSAEKLGRETSFTAKQVAEGMTALGRMGFSSSEIDHAIGSVLDLSRATGTDLGDAAEIAANNMRG
jgi:hypothetical protein